jgi:hypothetical protein
VKVVNKHDNFSWKIINVYGPVRNEKKGIFSQELYQKQLRCEVLVVVCGDLNMIKYGFEKSTRANYSIWMDMFNSFLNDTALLKIYRGGDRFTWQINKETML